MEAHSQEMPQSLESAKTDNLYVCVQCGKAFTSEGLLLGHMRNDSHCNGLLLSERISDVQQNSDEDEASYYCRHCGKAYVNKTSLIKHCETHLTSILQYEETCIVEEPIGDQVVYSVEELALPDQEVQNIEPTSHEPVVRYIDELHSCSICNKTFKSTSGLKEHLKIHEGVMSLCIVCGKAFTRERNLARHMRIHSGERPYSCTVCNKSFVQQGTLMAHQRTHSGEKPYLCSYCGKGFSLSHGLEAHVRTHTGVKPYICSVCQKGFATRGNLQVHVKSHLKVGKS